MLFKCSPEWRASGVLERGRWNLHHVLFELWKTESSSTLKINPLIRALIRRRSVCFYVPYSLASSGALKIFAMTSVSVVFWIVMHMILIPIKMLKGFKFKLLKGFHSLMRIIWRKKFWIVGDCVREMLCFSGKRLRSRRPGYE